MIYGLDVLNDIFDRVRDDTADQPPPPRLATFTHIPSPDVTLSCSDDESFYLPPFTASEPDGEKPGRNDRLVDSIDPFNAMDQCCDA